MPAPRRRRTKFDPANPPGTRVSDAAMARLFAEFDGKLISPGGAAALLGISRQRIHILIEKGRLRCYRSEEVRERWGIFVTEPAAKWAYIPQADVYRLAGELGRPLPPLPTDV
jgi:hypothetical protein